MFQVIVKESSYDYEELRANVFGILSCLDKGTIKKGSRVLIKPNLLAPTSQEQAVTTHPLVIKAAVEYVVSKGGKVQVSDSPPMGSFDKITKESGLIEALQGLPVLVREFKTSRDIRAEGKFKNIELAVDALEADIIINLPKLKTHSQMTLTLAVKNLFGCIVGTKKAEWHYKVGENRELFAELLVSVYRALRPSINLMDGILAMQGDGPGTGGTPRHIGVLIGSDDALCIDIAVCRIVGIEPFSLLTNKVAKEMGMTKDFKVSGEAPVLRDFALPAVTDLMFGPKFAHKFLRRHLTSRPVNIEDICKLCDECIKICPANAIENAGGRLEFDYETCIRCYCCLEVCPHRAMKRHEPLVKKIIGKFYGLRR